MQGDSYPAFPANASLPGQTNDVTSFQQPNSSTIITSYGIDTPRRSSDTRLGLEWEAVFDFQGVGAMSTTNNSWAVLAWGYDTCGIPYFVAYESEIADINDPPGLVIHSRSDQGPTKETLAEIFSSLRAVGNKEITALVEQTKPTIQDGERRGQAPVVCNDACVNNTIYSA